MEIAKPAEIPEKDAENIKAVENFQNYIRIKSVHPNPDYDGCISWVKAQSEEIGLEFNTVRFSAPAEFTVWCTWRGTNPSLKSVMLNSHMDVVPVDVKNWSVDPFEAHKDSNGKIYGRGTQDMKSIGVQYLEAIRRLKRKGFQPLRNIHVTFVPDEERGGEKGMAEFVKSKEFLELNVGIALDEGIPNPDENFLVFRNERTGIQIRFIITGNTGHAMKFIENTVGEKLEKIINRILAFREAEKNRFLDNPTLTLGDVTTVNMTMIKGGTQENVLPSQIEVNFDMRISPIWGVTEALKFIQDVGENAGPGVSYEFINNPNLQPMPDNTSDEFNIWWSEFESIFDTLGLKFTSHVFPGATDSRYVRKQGIPAIGFSPINLTPSLLHDNDEYLNEKTFLKGISIYEEIIRRFSSLP